MKRTTKRKSKESRNPEVNDNRYNGEGLDIKMITGERILDTKILIQRYLDTKIEGGLS